MSNINLNKGFYIDRLIKGIYLIEEKNDIVEKPILGQNNALHKNHTESKCIIVECNDCVIKYTPHFKEGINATFRIGINYNRLNYNDESSIINLFIDEVIFNNTIKEINDINEFLILKHKEDYVELFISNVSSKDNPIYITEEVFLLTANEYNEIINKLQDTKTEAIKRYIKETTIQKVI